MATENIIVPDIGGAENVEVIEVCVKPGDAVNKDDSLIVLESDKASMEVPAPMAGTVKSISLKVGDKVSQGSAILELDIDSASAASVKPAATAKPEPMPQARAPEPVAAPVPAEAARGTPALETIAVPDIGSSGSVDVIEISVKPGDTLAEGDTMVVLESDKASMEVPAPKAGVVHALKISVGDKVSSGSALLELETAAASAGAVAPAPAAAVSAPAPAIPAATAASAGADEGDVYAGPAVRRLAREMGIDLARVSGSGPKGRIQKDDVKAFVKGLMENRAPASASPGSGAGIPVVPEIDFAQFGPIDTQPLTALQKAIVANMHRAWLNVPHVTQWDDADITDLEAFRETLKADAEKRGVKLSPLPFLLKALAAALKANPKFCSSLHSDGARIVYKQYIHVGMAVDTPAGLVVPVLRDIDKKSIWELAAEAAELAQKARDRKLKVAEMQGACFTISSLGNIGGLGFSPIVNTPEVGILGVSKLTVKPVWNGSEFVPRKMLPLSLSYDHRVINGGDAGRFFQMLNQLLGDVRRLAL